MSEKNCRDCKHYNECEIIEHVIDTVDDRLMVLLFGHCNMREEYGETVSDPVNCKDCLNFPCNRVKEYMDNDDIVEADSIDVDVLIGFASNCTEADSPNSIECEYSDEEIEVENAPGK